jgi:hypothetical protein
MTEHRIGAQEEWQAERDELLEAAAFATGCDRLRPLGSISAPCFVVWSDDG